MLEMQQIKKFEEVFEDISKISPKVPMIGTVVEHGRLLGIIYSPKQYQDEMTLLVNHHMPVLHQVREGEDYITIYFTNTRDLKEGNWKLPESIYTCPPCYFDARKEGLESDAVKCTIQETLESFVKTPFLGVILQLEGPGIFPTRVRIYLREHQQGDKSLFLQRKPSKSVFNYQGDYPPGGIQEHLTKLGQDILKEIGEKNTCVVFESLVFHRGKNDSIQITIKNGLSSYDFTPRIMVYAEKEGFRIVEAITRRILRGINVKNLS